MTRPRLRVARAIVLVAMGMAALLLPSPARAGDDTAPSSPRAGALPPGAQTTHRLWWWSIPRGGRKAVKTVARREHAIVSTCYRIERDDVIIYEVHGRRRAGAGLLKWDDVVLTSASEPREQYEERQAAQSFRGRMQILRDKLTPEPDSFVPVEK